MADSERTRRPLIVAALKWAWLRPAVDPLSGSVRVGAHDTGTSVADLAALEHALRVAEQRGGHVVAITLGPPAADQILRDALAAGADHALRVDAAGQESGEVPPQSLVGNGRQVAQAIAWAVRDRFGTPDLVLCGDRSVDLGTGAVPAFLAAELGAAQALGVVSLAADDEGGLLVHRRLDHGRREVLRVPWPAVVSVEAAGVHLRRASLPAVVSARQAEIPVALSSTVDDGGPRLLGRGPFRPRTRVLAPPKGERPVERLRALTGASSDSSPARVVGPLPATEAAEELLAFLRERGYVSEAGEGSRI